MHGKQNVIIFLYYVVYILHDKTFAWLSFLPPEGNVFTDICHSVQRGRYAWSWVPSRGGYTRGGVYQWRMDE